MAVLHPPVLIGTETSVAPKNDGVVKLSGRFASSRPELPAFSGGGAAPGGIKRIFSVICSADTRISKRYLFLNTA
jgi:hypothetical protein